MEGEEDEKILTSFQSLEFLIGVAELLKLDLDIIPIKREDAKEVKALERLCSILDEYQEQSYLLDPYLEQLVQPLIAVYRARIRVPGVSFTTPRVGRLSHLIYFFTKVRGAKTIVRLFPHEVDDLSILLAIFEKPETLREASWELRYVLLLWLSLVSLLPFSFASIDHRELDSSSGRSLSKIERIGLRFLGVPGKEREGAIAVLARYYSRQDSIISDFVRSCQEAIMAPSTSVFMSSGILQTLSEIVKIGSPKKVLAAGVEFDLFLEACDSINESKQIGVTKARIKLSGRLAILRLAATGDIDEAEGVIQELFEALGSPDTIVRWSAAKYLARISERLPEASSHQIVEALLDIFVTEDVALDHVRAAENSWQGACLSLAELARRGKIPEDLISDLLTSVLRALNFDRKRGVQSVGSGVRDAAAYVLWSLARTITPAQALPHAEKLAMHIICASLFDREIQIRRAASAAYQESVGRWGVFPHGIDVLRTVDFLTVSVRKRAFLEAAIEVARHSEYRPFLINHLIDVSLIHYDPEIRTLASNSLERIVVLDVEGLIPILVSKQILALNTKDNVVLHGALLFLNSLAIASRNLPESQRLSIQSEILRSLSSIHITTFSSRAYLLLLPAALKVIESSCTPEAIEQTKDWWSIVTLACSKFDEETHRQAASTMRSVSAKVDSLSSRTSAIQQSAPLILGCIDYSTLNSKRLSIVVDRLVLFCGGDTTQNASSIEGKRNGIISLTSIICDLQSFLTPQQLTSIFDTILAGFADYTVDQRGDVGSWIRLASIAALNRFFSSVQYLEAVKILSRSQIDSAWASLLKQSLERLDKIREAAGNALQKCRNNFILSLESSDIFYNSLIPRINESAEWKDIQWASERILPFLNFEKYRKILLEGAALGITLHSSSSPFFDYAISLPPHFSSQLSLHRLVECLCEIATENFTTNRIFIPILHALSIVTEIGAQQSEAFDPVITQKILALSTRAIPGIKSSPRLNASLKLIINLIQLSPSSFSKAAPKMKNFLSHPLPWFRKQVAESLYDHNVGAESEEFETLQTLLLETQWGENPSLEEASKVSEVLSKIASVQLELIN